MKSFKTFSASALVITMLAAASSLALTPLHLEPPGHHDGIRSPRDEHRDRLPAATLLQLESARQAAGRFFDVQAALDAGYVNIDLFIPHMGWHFLNPKILDGHFDPAEPEILVYQENSDGTLRLSAVEYAIPTELSPNPPQGFAGQSDVWFNDTGFKLWTLHAWIYDFNPDGVFTSRNPRLP
jgi:hypothetical protein